jgi:hypothetical protein
MDLKRGDIHGLGDGAGYVEIVDPGPAPGIRVDGATDLERLCKWLTDLHYQRLVVHRGEQRYEMSGGEAIHSFITGLKIGRDHEREHAV